MTRRRRLFVYTPLLASVFFAICIGSSGKAQGAAEQRELYPKGHYAQLTNVYRDHVNFNVETVSGLAIASDGDFYAINTHGSLLTRHADDTPEPEGSWATVHNPVSMGILGDLALVAGGSSHALAIHDRFNGEVLVIHRLPNEPGDLVIDELTGIVYVASQAENIVVAIDVNDLSDVREVRRYTIPGEKPRFMNIDVHPVSGDRSLIVAPMLSGNNTIPVPGRKGTDLSLEQSTGDVFNLSVLAEGGLPDEDLFVIPLVGDSLPAQFNSGRQAGTLMMAHGRNPVTGEYWALNVDLHNDIPGQRAESELTGIFATNALTIFSPTGLDTVKGLPNRVVDLDDANHLLPGDQYASETSVSFPYALAFVPADSPNFPGWAAIASSTGDLVALMNPSGNRMSTIALPKGSIPRDLIVEPMGRWLGVYCWGTNEIRVYILSDLSLPSMNLELGVDPTPEPIKQGREIFYDAHPSMHGRTTCATCHASGGGDNLSWKLSGLGDDQKDVMITQSLIGIQDTPLYHWREERTLEDFNVAFPGLLGHDEPLDESPDAELDDLVDFIQSLQAHANHEQNLRRVLRDEPTARKFRNGFAGSAVRGQDVFLTVPSGSTLSCGECHIFPSGTLGVAVPDADPAICRAQGVGVAHLRQMNHRDQDLVEVSDPIFGPTGSVLLPRGGHALLHSGNVLDIFAFAEGFEALTPQQQSDVAAFLHQYDQGTAPAAHFAIQMTADNVDAAETRVRNLLLRQAGRGWIDVVAFGLFGMDNSRHLRWVYRPGPGGTEGVFESDGLTLTRTTLSQLATLTSNGMTRPVFLGLVPGTGPMWALDPDGDGLNRDQEGANGTDVDDIDTDDDTFPDGYEVTHGSDPLVANASVNDSSPPLLRPGFPQLDHATATFAKFFVHYDEPVQLQIETSVSGGTVHQTRVRPFAYRHTVVVQGLDPSPRTGPANAYTSVIRAIDYSGNESTSSLDFEVLASCTGVELVHVNGLRWIEMIPTGEQTYSAIAEVLVELEEGAPFPPPAVGHVVVAKLFSRTHPDAPWKAAKGVTSPHMRNSFKVRHVDPDDGSTTISEYTNIPGPFLLSPTTDASGHSRISFFFPAIVAPGTTVEMRLSIQAVLLPSPTHTPGDPIFEADSIQLWSMPATAPQFRGIEFGL